MSDGMGLREKLEATLAANKRLEEVNQHLRKRIRNLRIQVKALDNVLARTRLLNTILRDRVAGNGEHLVATQPAPEHQVEMH